MRSGYLFSFVARGSSLSARLVAVPASSRAATDGADGGDPGTGGSIGFDGARPDIDDDRGRQPDAVRQRRAGPGRAVRRRQQDGRRRLQRDLPGPGGLDLHRMAQHCTMAASAATASSAPARRATTATRRAATAAPPTARPSRRGYECRVPGRKCVPACGDGMKHRHGAVRRRQRRQRRRLLADLPDRARRALHRERPERLQGLHLRQRREGRQRGLRLRHQPGGPWPTGCTGPNGLFFGDGTGCSKTCTKEPTCRDRRQAPEAAPSSCGNGARRDRRGLRRRQPRRRRRLLVRLHGRGRLHLRRRRAGRHGGLHAAGQQRQVPASSRSSTATSRTRA